MEAILGLFAGAAAPAAAGTAAASTFTMAAPWTFAAGAAAPAAAATAGAGIGLGTILSGVGAGASLLQGLAGYRSGQANAANLEAANLQSLQAGAANKDIADARNRARLGEMNAQMGAQGTTSSGSPLLVYLDSVQQGAIESANEYYQGRVKSVGYKGQAKIERMGGGADLWKGIVGGAGSLGTALTR